MSTANLVERRAATSRSAILVERIIAKALIEFGRFSYR